MSEETLEELRRRCDVLEALLEKSSLPLEKVVTSSGKYVKWIQGILGLLIVVVTLGISWGVTTTKIEVIETTVQHQKLVVGSRLEKTEEDIHELQLKQAGNDQILKNDQLTIYEIKADVKALTQRK